MSDYINKSNKQLIQDLQQDMLELPVGSSSCESSNQLSRMSYYSGGVSSVTDGIIDFYYNIADGIHNNLNIPFTNQTGDSSPSGWFLSEETYKIEYKCNFDSGSYGNRLGIKNTFMFQRKGGTNNRAHHLPLLVEFVKQLPLRASDGARVALLEDSAQSAGATWQGQHLGTWGDLGTFGFSSPKIISTGQGGAVVIPKRAGNGNTTGISAQSEMAARVRRLKNFGRAKSGADAYLEPPALNFKFTDLQAVVGRVQLQKLPDRVVRMRQFWERYEAGLREILGATMLRPDCNVVVEDGETAGTCESSSHGGGDAGWIPWFVDISVEGEDGADASATRSTLLKWLKTHRVGARPMYPSLSSEQALAAHPQAPSQASPNGSFSVSRRAAHAGLFLPSSTLYDNGTLDHVCALIRFFFTSGGRHGPGGTPQ